MLSVLESWLVGWLHELVFVRWCGTSNALVCTDARQHDASETNSSSLEVHKTDVEVTARRGLPQVEADVAESREVQDLGAELFRRLRDSDSDDDDTMPNKAHLGE